MKKKRRNDLFRVLLFILLMIVSIVYAVLSTNLKINGFSKINNSNWDIHFANVVVNSNSVSIGTGDQAATITANNNTEVTYTVTLSKPGDFYEFTVDAVNAGSIDGMISAIVSKLNNTVIDTNHPLPNYLSYSVTYSDGIELANNQYLKAGDTETYKVRVEFLKDIENNQLPSSDQNLSFSFSVTYVQADDNAVEVNRSSITYINRQVEGQITPGDIIGIGETEDFYVLSSNSEKTVLLAKYNLLVGFDENDSPIQSSISGYGLQNYYATGYNLAFDESVYATVAFSSAIYWDSGNGTLLSPYNANGASYEGNPYPYVYDNQYVTAPVFDNDNFTSEGYSIAYYVELYKSKLIEMGAPNTIVGRLLSYEEGEAASTIQDDGISIIFNGHQTYWIGSALSNDSMFTCYTTDGSFMPHSIGHDGQVGVRPVIEIPTSEIN